MSEELRPCPFCGGKAVTSTFFDWDDFEYMPIEVNDSDVEVTCENERCINGWYLSPKAWNTRPIEDALRVQLAARDALIERLVEVGNDIVEEAQLQEPDVQELRDNWQVLIAEWKASKDGGGK